MDTVLMASGGGFTELHLDLDNEWETPHRDEVQDEELIIDEQPVTVERPYTPLELLIIEQMRIDRDERRKRDARA